jgi:integrase
MENAMNFREQAETYMLEIASRKADPVRPTTLHVYRSLLDARILPAIGSVEMAVVNNKTAKKLVSRLTEAQLSPATVTLAVSLMKQIVASATDDEGTYLYPVKWNPKFIDAPRVDTATQKTPITPSGTLTEAISRTSGEVRALVALLGGTGLRIGEALALTFEDWDAENRTLNVRTTMSNGVVQPNPKTKAGNRVVDLDPALNAFLCSQFANREGRIFTSGERTLRRRLAALGIEGFHSLRRFRITHLQGSNVPSTMIKFWAGHAAGDVTERYTKVGSQIQERKVWSEKAGLGFTL